MRETDNRNKSRLLVTREGVRYVLPFIVVTCCFALWGFANDITNPMVKAFSKIFRMSVTRMKERRYFFSISFIGTG